MITLRQATPDDSEFAYRAKRAAFKEYAEQVWGWREEEQRRLHGQRFQAGVFRVIEAAGIPVGILAVTMAPDCVQLHQLFLLPEYQGQGIGRQCMQHLMDEARLLQLPMRLRVLKVNPRARVFYERLGFACVGGQLTHDLMEWRPTRPFPEPRGRPTKEVTE